MIKLCCFLTLPISIIGIFFVISFFYNINHCSFINVTNPMAIHILRNPDQPSDSHSHRAPSQLIIPLRPKRAPAPALLQKFAGWFEINEPRVLNCTAMKSMASPNCCAHLGRLARPDFGTCQVDDSSENRVPSKSSRFVIIIPMERAIFGWPIPRGFPEPCNLVHLKYGKTKRRISW